jgi:transcriptional regulator with XRE-family HTH domain
MIANDVIELLRNEIAERYRTQANFCAAVGIDKGYLSRVLAGKLKPSPPILKALKLRKVVSVSYERD